MEVFVLGSGVGIPSLKRRYPGLFVKCKKDTILIDPGPGSLRQLLKLGVTYNDVDSVLLTHFHPDHCLDLISFVFACRYPLLPRRKGVSVVGPVGLKSFYSGLSGVFGSAVKPETFELRLEEVRDGTLELGKARLYIKPVEHTKESIGMRYEGGDGKILCYSGDTGYCGGIVDLAVDSDLLILESSFPEGAEAEGHLTPSLAGRIAREAGAKKLILTHIYPVCEGHDILSQCKKEFGGEVLVASDLMKIEI